MFLANRFLPSDLFGVFAGQTMGQLTNRAAAELN